MAAGDPDLIEEMIHDRGEAYYYDMPLQIAENKRCTTTQGCVYEAEKERLTALKELLKSYGAKLLHIFPIKDLPGYVKRT